MHTLEPRPHSLSPRGLAIAGWTALAIAIGTFLALGWNLGPGSPLVGLDARVTGWMAGHRSTTASSFFLAITHLHSLVAIAGWSVLFAAILWRLRERYWVVTLAAAVGGGMVLNWILKLAYERARPALDVRVVELSTFSFPSGHTAASTVFYGVLAAFLVSRFNDPRIRAAIVAAGVTAVVLVATSRVYLGAHFLSDVVAAACSSTAWLVICLSTGHALVRRRMARS